ncbi:HAD family hydrolase [Magnetofaba australis]|nr:HAD-IIIA family hydrolase [Magnetofaba australis]
MSSNRYELVIFDVDGTLMDSLGAISHVVNLSLKELGLPTISHASVGAIVGLSLDAAAQRLLPSATQQTRDQLVALYRQHYKALADANSLDHELFPGVRDTLYELKGRGVTLALATGKSMRGVERMIEEQNFHGLFAAIKTADCAPSKPHPGMLEQALAETAMPPEMALMVGDTDFDLLMANSAGVDACAFPSGAHPRERLAAANPKYWIDAIPQVLDIVSGKR